MIGRTLSAFAAMSLVAAPVAAQEAMSNARGAAPVAAGEEAAGGTELIGLLAFLAVIAGIVVVVNSSDDDGTPAPVSP